MSYSKRKIFATSDPHFGHAKIMEHCDRKFRNVREMDDTIIKNYNEVVGKEDVCYFLGDMMMGKNEDFLQRTIERLNGEKILILGNHDEIKPFHYVNLGFKHVHTALEMNIEGLGDVVLVHDPAAACTDKKKLFLVGHVHTLFKMCDNALNVGVDVRNFRPMSVEQIIQEVQESEWLKKLKEDVV